MSKKKLAGLIVGCIIVVIVVVVITTLQPPPKPAYILSVSVSPLGVGSVSPSGGEYESGAQVTLIASPTSDYTFEYWDGDASGSTNTVTITMNSNKTITAHFKVVEPSPVVENRPPFIMQLVPDGWSAVAGTNTMIGIDITCEASDPDGDTISFSWEANEGTITGTGGEAQWLIPAEPGRYVIEVTVNDGKGGKSSASMTDDLESVQVIGNTCHTSGSRSFSYEGH